MESLYIIFLILDKVQIEKISKLFIHEKIKRNYRNWSRTEIDKLDMKEKRNRRRHT